MITNLELLSSSDAVADLQTIDSRIKVFCPFEAIGMVHQEIRHSNFLAYILDPNRPHGMGSHMLEALISELRFDDPDQGSDARTLNLRMPVATVERERMSIDLLIEIPGPRNAKSLVIAIEVKIHAGEGEDQLNRYESKLQEAYPTIHWDHRRVFLTLDGREAQTAGQGSWQAISFERLFRRFNEAIRVNQLVGPAVLLYQNYEMMMRRYGMVQQNVDPELDAAVKRLWSEHREALEFLMVRRPAPVQELIREFDQNPVRFAEILSAKLGQDVSVDSNWARWRRIRIPGLLGIDPRMGTGDKGWVKSGSMAVLELNPQGDKIDASIAVNGQSSAPDFRNKLLDGLSYATSGNGLTPEEKVYHFWYQKLLTAEGISSEMEAGADPLEYLAETLAARFSDNLRVLTECAERARSA